jgi:hypothetical protein
VVNHRKVKSVHYKMHLGTSPHLIRKWKREFFYINKMHNQSSIKLYVPNNMAWIN